MHNWTRVYDLKYFRFCQGVRDVWRPRHLLARGRGREGREGVHHRGQRFGHRFARGKSGGRQEEHCGPRPPTHGGQLSNVFLFFCVLRFDFNLGKVQRLALLLLNMILFLIKSY
jgi:hypothetical protein